VLSDRRMEAAQGRLPFDISSACYHHNLLGKSGAFLPPRNNLSISSPIHMSLLRAIPASIFAILSACTITPEPLLFIPPAINPATANAIASGRLIGTPTFCIFAAHSSMLRLWVRSLRSCPRMGVTVIPGATTLIAMERVATSCFRARIRPTIPRDGGVSPTYSYSLHPHIRNSREAASSKRQNKHKLTMLRSAIQRCARTGQIPGDTRRHDNTPTPALPMFSILPHPVDGQLDGVICGVQVDVHASSIGFGELAGSVERIGEELVAMFSDAGVDVDGVDVGEFGDC
jgi:hypothetical protein